MSNWLKIFCVILVWAVSSFGASAQDTKAQEARKAKLEREIAIIDKQLSENASRSNAMLSNLTLIRKKVSNRKALVAESDRQIKKYSDDIYLKQRQINRLQARVDTLTAHYSRLVLSAYKNRDSRIWYMYILATTSLKFCPFLSILVICDISILNLIVYYSTSFTKRTGKQPT